MNIHLIGWQTVIQFAELVRNRPPDSPIFGNGKDDLGFGAKAGGAHFAKSDVPIKERKFEEAGKKAYFWTSEGEVLVFFHDKDFAKFEQFDPEFGASLRCIKD